MADRNLYKVLQVDASAELDVIAAAYRVLAARLHPDRDSSGVDEVRLAELNRAYAVLRDPEQRRAYDASLRQVEDARVPMGPGSAAGGTLGERLHARETDELRNTRLDFGRYSGWTLGELARSDPDYLRWLSRHSSGIRYRRAILRLLAEQDARRRPLNVQR